LHAYYDDDDDEDNEFEDEEKGEEGEDSLDEGRFSSQPRAIHRPIDDDELSEPLFHFCITILTQHFQSNEEWRYIKSEGWTLETAM